MDDTGAFGTTGLRRYLSQGSAARSATAEPQRRGAWSAWIAMALASTLYPAWRPLFVHSLPLDVDPVWERLAIGG